MKGIVVLKSSKEERKIAQKDFKDHLKSLSKKKQ